jgi:hypothetical protein
MPSASTLAADQALQDAMNDFNSINASYLGGQ